MYKHCNRSQVSIKLLKLGLHCLESVVDKALSEKALKEASLVICLLQWHCDLEVAGSIPVNAKNLTSRFTLDLNKNRYQ